MPLEYLLQFVTPERRDKMFDVIDKRTDFVRVVLEDIFQPHNASAVIRSCECFGINNLHVIENKYAYTVNPDVAMGSSKWIHMNRHREEATDNSQACIDLLRQKGYRIAATCLDQDSIPIEDVPLDQPLALCFGTEETGLSKTILDSADLKVHIPMFGFTQSFNISVSAAICLASLRRRIEEDFDAFRLDPKARQATLLAWLKKSIPHFDRVQKHYRNTQGSGLPDCQIS